MSLYDELGVAPDASDDEIKAAHRRAARKHHPDTGGDPEAFQRIQHAAMVLRDPDKRERYDRTGESGSEPDNSRSLAVQFLCNAFAQALEGPHDPRYTDIAGAAKAILNEQIGQLKAQRSQVKQARDKAASALKRLGHSGDGPNYIAVMITDRIRDLDKMLADIERNTSQRTEAIEMAATFTWRVDERPQQAVFTSSTSTSTASGIWR